MMTFFNSCTKKTLSAIYLLFLGATAVSGDRFSGNDVPIWLNNVQCTGNEAKLLDCSSNQLGLTSCRHSNDAGVICPETSGKSKEFLKTIVLWWMRQTSGTSDDEQEHMGQPFCPG